MLFAAFLQKFRNCQFLFTFQVIKIVYKTLCFYTKKILSNWNFMFSCKFMPYLQHFSPKTETFFLIHVHMTMMWKRWHRSVITTENIVLIRPVIGNVSNWDSTGQTTDAANPVCRRSITNFTQLAADMLLDLRSEWGDVQAFRYDSA